MTKHEVSEVSVVASDVEYSIVFPMPANLPLIFEYVDPRIMADKYANIPAHTGWYFTSTFHKEPAPSLNPSLVKLPKPCVVCITGGGRGLGEEYAVAFAKAGASGIILAARSQNELEAVARRLKSIRSAIKVSTVRCDVTSEKDVGSLARVILDEHDGRCDVLINNAAYLDHGWQPMTDIEPDDFRQAMDVNVFGTWSITRALIPIILKSSTGLKTIITITSMSSHVARPSISMGMSKLALNRFVEYLAGAYAKEDLMSYALHPGGVKTAMNQDSTKVPPDLAALCTDSIELSPAMAVWLAKENRPWLNGRYVASNWDVTELEVKRDQIEKNDLLKFRMSV